MIGIIKDENRLLIELHPTKTNKWNFTIPCNCNKFGEYGISFGKYFTIYWEWSGYHSFKDFYRCEFKKKDMK